MCIKLQIIMSHIIHVVGSKSGLSFPLGNLFPVQILMYFHATCPKTPWIFFSAHLARRFFVYPLAVFQVTYYPKCEVGIRGRGNAAQYQVVLMDHVSH